MQTCNIDDLVDLIGDERDYPASNGVRRPDCPAFIFRDERTAPDLVTGWGRDLALDFEEFVARRNHEEALDSRVESGFAKTRVVNGTRQYVSDEYEAPTPEDVSAYLERQEARGLCNWLVDFAKRRPPTNDHWRKLVAPLAAKLDDPVLGSTARVILSTLKAELPFAPGPVTGTTFVNPDGSKFTSAGTSPGTAKASFRKRHALDDEFVSVDRVQYEGERGSRYIVGTRRSSEATPSRYYDPNPQWQDNRTKEGYLPNGAAFLVMVGESMVMPSGSHRLTVREFEQAIIAGAEVLEDELERTACELEMEYLPDPRVLMINTGYGSAQNDPMVFSHEEDYLMGVFRRFAKDADDAFWKDACEKMMLRDEDANVLKDHFHTLTWGDAKPVAQLVDLLDFVSWSDKNAPSEDGPHLPYVLSVLTYDSDPVRPDADVVESYSNAVALFDDDEHAWEIPTNEGTRLCSFRNWK